MWFQRVALPRRVARLYPAYGLYLYGEGVYAQETRALKLTGAPVLFLPGNAGSYKQGKSAKLIMVQCLHLNYHEEVGGKTEKLSFVLQQRQRRNGGHQAFC